MDDKDKIVAELAKLPTVSEKCALGMYLLGIRKQDDLKGQDPVELYSQLRERDDFYAEPCMLNMLKIAVGMANKGISDLSKG